ncbi:hypothetical protein E2C01_014253 [Portunus trituberculatus]|uniref:Uncharacterized protein n=1 Tax=Portunus trituberculatus TaxID=210409 RepID=A0A5B7DIA2_PORTR|nr:hypothetical protein [Portunus trituberculatus]
MVLKGLSFIPTTHPQPTYPHDTQEALPHSSSPALSHSATDLQAKKDSGPSQSPQRVSRTKIHKSVVTPAKLHRL